MQARHALTDPHSATLDAQLLLAWALGMERTELLAHGDTVLNDAELARYQHWIERRSQGEPYAYIIGEQPFYDLTFAVSPAVLIPRPETELLVERALEILAGYELATVADIGTGSGTIAVTVARHAPQARMYATDISPQALDVAQYNADQHQVRLRLRDGSLAQPLIEEGILVDVLLANLPYIASEELWNLEVSRHEPHLALNGGSDGLRLIEQLLHQLPQVMSPGGWVLLEIGSGQADAVLAMAAFLNPMATKVHHDYAGHERIVELHLSTQK